MADLALSRFIADATRLPVLPLEQQLHLSRQVRAWLDWPEDSGPCPQTTRRRGERAKQRLIETNIRLVISQSKLYRHVYQTGPDLQLDLIQEGTFGLARAAEKFDPARGYSFTTYAVPWIRQAMSRSASYLPIIRRPEHICWRLKKLTRLISDYEAANAGKRPPIEYLAERTGFDEDKIRDLIVIGSMKTYSLDYTLDSDTPLIDTIAAPETFNGLDQAQHQELLAAIEKLPERERTTIKLIDLQNHTHAETGQVIGAQRTRTGQIRNRAIRLLREHLAGLPAAGICIQCGKQFEPCQNQKTCSAQCKQERANQVNRDYRQRAKETPIAA